jgi:hypothetical protein
MKRYYQNLSNEPMKFRVWKLTRTELNESDVKWLNGFDISFRLDRDRQTFETSRGTYQYAGPNTITLDTTTDRQRDMIVLKYGSDAVLIQETIVLPGTLSTCTLSDISW